MGQCDNKICNCNHEGRVVQIGAIFDKGDGCNQCQCMQNGQVSCSSNAVPCKCQWNGMELNIGQTRPQDCNLCTCLSSGNVQCTNKPCDCNYNGRRYAFGETFEKSTAPQDACNTCTCQNSGQVQCTSNKCGCDVGGSVIDPGTVFNQDECNTCTCMANFQLECTNKPCHCKHNGQTIPIGQQVAKQCNTCVCQQNGQLVCTQDPCSCQAQGMTYTIGQEFNLIASPCTKCSCTFGGKVECNSSDCTAEPIVNGCLRNGTQLAIGETYKDDCNTCQCTKQQTGINVITCTQKTCGCQDPSQPARIFKSGEKWQKEGNCVTCECLPSFNVNCIKTCNTKTGRRRR